MARRAILAGNWKMYMLSGPAKELASDLAAKVGKVADRDIVLIPPFTALATVREAIAGTTIALGAQNGYPKNEGAFTGEVSMAMLADAGCRYVVIGHSERRQFFGETNAGCKEKIVAAFAAGLTPIYCIGELLAEREAGHTFAVVKQQLEEGLAGLDTALAPKLVLAYEPVWAIGTGKTATPEQAQAVHAFIRGRIATLDKGVAEGLTIQYGGSVKAANAAELMIQPDIDGGLIGGASLIADEFAAICKAAAR